MKMTFIALVIALAAASSSVTASTTSGYSNQGFTKMFTTTHEVDDRRGSRRRGR